MASVSKGVSRSYTSEVGRFSSRTTGLSTKLIAQTASPSVSHRLVALMRGNVLFCPRTLYVAAATGLLLSCPA